MSEPWIVYLLIFVSVAIGVQFAQVGLRSLIQSERRTSKRFATLSRGESSAPKVDVLRKKASDSVIGTIVTKLQRLIVQSGTGLTLSGLGLRVALVWIALLLVPLPLPGFARVVVTGTGASFVLFGYLSYRRRRRIARFAEQLPDVIDIIVRSLRAGHPVPVSLALVSREMSEPAGPEFSAVVDEINYGRSVNDALEMLETRVGYREVDFFVSSITIAQQTGGNLAEILMRVAKMLRERFRLKRRIRALSAEGRFSGYALSLLPILLFGLINIVSTSYYQEFWQSSAKIPVLSIAGGMLIVGNIIIYNLVNFKV
ncbi:MAG: type II secretion system F family protein [Burkholderiaceae bacterium]